MMKSAILFLINEIWINMFVNPIFFFLLFNTLYHDIFWDDYHTVKISYRYNPRSN